jgi:hypothetical protein
MTRVAFAAPFGLESTLRFVRAAACLPGVRLGIISQESAETVSAKLPEAHAVSWPATCGSGDAHDVDQMARAVQELGQVLGGRVDRLIGILESLQVPLATVRERALDPRHGHREAERFRDKSVMKDALRAAGLPVRAPPPGDQRDEAFAFARQVMPLVAKPPAGAGARDTFRVERVEELQLVAAQCTADDASGPLLLEEFLTGDGTLLRLRHARRPHRLLLDLGLRADAADGDGERRGSSGR